MDPDSILRRVILPALNVCGVCSKTVEEHKPSTAHKYERNSVLPSGAAGMRSDVA